MGRVVVVCGCVQAPPSQTIATGYGLGRETATIGLPRDEAARNRKIFEATWDDATGYWVHNVGRRPAAAVWAGDRPAVVDEWPNSRIWHLESRMPGVFNGEALADYARLAAARSATQAEDWAEFCEARNVADGDAAGRWLRLTVRCSLCHLQWELDAVSADYVTALAASRPIPGSKPNGRWGVASIAAYTGGPARPVAYDPAKADDPPF
ncbi:MAG: hypothetical protein LBD90_01600 [Bifidobacteriaceae bacterium]|nr:hypothetical protein [Bifidobacteriaceae bacterium]